MALFHLAYTSASTGLPDSDALAAILKVSRRNNDRDGLTGMLLYHEGSFLQVLEGQEAAVRECYAAIARDPRHQSCLQLLSEEIAARQFRDWSMGFVPVETLDEEAKSAFFNLLAFRRPGAAKALGDAPSKRLVRSFLAGFGSQFAI